MKATRTMMKSLLMCVLAAVAMGCVEERDPRPTATGDSRDAAFLVGGKADNGIGEGSETARLVLSFVNDASFELLDVEAGLDRRAATNIVAYRLGDDGQSGTADDDTFDTLAELDAIPYVGPVAFESLVEYVRSSNTETKIIVNGYEEGSTEAAIILHAANGLDLQTLDDEARLDVRAARNIVSYREGDDAMPGTVDDRRFDSLIELDNISYVGESAFDSLLEFALATDFLPTDDGQLPHESDDVFDSEYCTGDPITNAEAAGHFAPGAEETVVAMGAFHRRSRTCNDVTGCSPWNVSDNDLETSLRFETRRDRISLAFTEVPLEGRINCRDDVTREPTGCSVSRSPDGPLDEGETHHNYQGKVTDHCVRLQHRARLELRGDRWEEVDYVYAARYAPAQPREVENPSTPSEDADPSTPFSAESCDGSAMTTEEAASFFVPGETRADFGTGQWQARDRNCNIFTGCSDWEAQSVTTESASTRLEATTDRVRVMLWDFPRVERLPHWRGETPATWVSCSGAYVDREQIECRLTRTRHVWTSGPHRFRGRVTPDCMRLEHVRTDDVSAKGSRYQKQFVFYQGH